MATEFQTSFIPKQAQQARSSGRHLSGGSFFFLLTLVIFLAVMGFTAAVFIWTKYTQQSISGLEQELKQSQEQYDRRFIEEAARLNTRIETSKKLLAQHVALSGILTYFENTTSRDVALNSMQIAYNEDDVMVLTATGVATDYPAIVGQSDAYGQGALLGDLIFEGLNANKDGLIEFKLSAIVDPKLFDYNAIVAGAIQTQGQQPDASIQLQDALQTQQGNPGGAIETQALPVPEFNNGTIQGEQNSNGSQI